MITEEIIEFMEAMCKDNGGDLPKLVEYAGSIVNIHNTPPWHSHRWLKLTWQEEDNKMWRDLQVEFLRADGLI